MQTFSTAVEIENYLMERADDGKEEPQCPEAYALLLRLRGFNQEFMFPGGFINQPHLQLLELEMCRRGENAYKNLVTANATRAANDNQTLGD